MMRIFIPSILLILISFQSVLAQNQSLADYVKRLKRSQVTGGSETAFLSIGSDFMYGQEYFETENWSSAAGYFMAILRKEKEHPYANYQLAVSLLKQNDPFKTELAMEYLEVAFKKIPALKSEFKAQYGNSLFVPGSSATKETVDFDKANSKQDPPVVANQAGSLESFIASIKKSRATGGALTFMNSAGLDAFYGIERFEYSEYSLAESSFSLSLSKDPGNPYVNYLKAVSMAAQGKLSEVNMLTTVAFAADASLSARFAEDIKTAREKWQAKEKENQVRPVPTAAPKYGGLLHYGKYTCHINVWNGPNVSPAYRPVYQGYFELRKDGTYRWLDDGPVGRYKYDAATGNITWLSGYFKGYTLRSTLYQQGTKTAQITITFDESLRWEAGSDR